jgi:hypothetical protein
LYSKDCPEQVDCLGNLSNRTALKMELILNLLWLALPAYWLWRRELAGARSGRPFRSQHSVLVRGCILIAVPRNFGYRRPALHTSGSGGIQSIETSAETNRQ